MLLAAIMPFVILGMLIAGVFMDNSGFRRKDDPEAVEEYRARVRARADVRIKDEIAAQARAIVSEEMWAVALQAEVERLRAERAAEQT